ncbi:hypothetical protein C8R44DRAFT_885490 [Mycena epipterygia]|nr:hypothetical protein C8R44DRAFT_885490 [Mycena epipterygia]
MGSSSRIQSARSHVSMLKLALISIPFLCSSALALATAAAFTSKNGIAAPEVVPVSTVGNVAAVQGTVLGDTRLFFQNPDNSIQQLDLNSPFNGGGHFQNSAVLVPANEVLANTPIAAVTINGTDLQEIHLFFVSPSNVLSEYIWTTSSSNWHGGPSCTTCITTIGFVVQPGSKVLYVMANDAVGSPATLRVGFVSAGAPGTFSEADFSPAKGWQLAQLPN